MLRREEHSSSDPFFPNLLIGPIRRKLSNNSPPVFICNSSISKAYMTSLDHHFADAANDGQKFIEGGWVKIFKESELWEK